ncbi:MAG: feaB [Bryobacterales bacterium]|nr:feaB [Bryobacterales bacterium]
MKIRTGRNYINGAWMTHERTFASVDPSTGRTLGTVALSREPEVDAAVTAAREAFRSWATTDVGERCRLVAAIASSLVSEYGEQLKESPLKNLITSEVGKRLPEADIEVIESSDMVSFFAVKAPDILGTRSLQLNADLWPTKRSRVVFEPIGVVAVIKPWNYPLELPLWSIAPALVAGNTVVFKPSEHSPLIGLEIARLCEQAGIPKGVVNVVTGDGETGRLLAQHPGVNKVSFTGSVGVGRRIGEDCGRRFLPHSLELGGNDAAIVLADVDVELAANGLVWGAFCNIGQVCVRPKRVLLHRSLREKLVDLIRAKTDEMRVDIDYGPMISERQRSTTASFVADAVSRGANLVAGGGAIDKEGFYYAPTVLTDVPPDAEVMREECFGPVMPVMFFDSESDAVALANASEYGLAASIWTTSTVTFERIAPQLNVGMVWMNDVNVAFPEAPWGGRKMSGIGAELSEFAILDYTRMKHVCVEASTEQRRAWWYPY